MTFNIAHDSHSDRIAAYHLRLKKQAEAIGCALNVESGFEIGTVAKVFNNGTKLVRMTLDDEHFFLEPRESIVFNFDDFDAFEIVALNNGL